MNKVWDQFEIDELIENIIILRFSRIPNSILFANETLMTLIIDILNLSSSTHNSSYQDMFLIKKGFTEVLQVYISRWVCFEKFTSRLNK